MRFSLFAHMERVDGGATHRELYDNLVELAQMADAGGMCTFWTGEHHGIEYTITPNPFLVLVDIARQTKHIRLGTGTVIAPFWHPIKLAGEAALADLLTDGRIELGIARGAYSFEYERLSPGLDAWTAGQKMREIAPLLPKLWAGDCENNGEFYPFPTTTSCPKPVQDGGIPIWVAARDPNSHEFALDHQFNVQVTPLWQGMDEIESLMARFQTAAETRGRTEIMLLQHGYIGEDMADCENGAEKLNRFYNYFGAWFKNEREITQGKLAPLTDDEIASNPMMSAKMMRENLLIGTKEEVIARLKAYEAMGYDEFSFWLDNGLSPVEKKEQLRRFIDDIMPAFR